MYSFLENYDLVDETNVVKYIDACTDYIMATIELFKLDPYPELDICITYSDAVDCYIEPYLRIFSEDKSLNYFDYLFMLKHSSISKYASVYSEITSYNSEFERTFLTVCLDIKTRIERAFTMISEGTTISDYNKVDNAICNYFAEEFYFEFSKVNFEHNLDPIESRFDYDRMLVKKKVIIELGDLCARGGIR